MFAHISMPYIVTHTRKCKRVTRLDNFLLSNSVRNQPYRGHIQIYLDWMCCSRCCFEISLRGAHDAAPIYFHSISYHVIWLDLELKVYFYRKQWNFVDESTKMVSKFFYCLILVTWSDDTKRLRCILINCYEDFTKWEIKVGGWAHIHYGIGEWDGCAKTEEKRILPQWIFIVDHHHHHHHVAGRPSK